MTEEKKKHLCASCGKELKPRRPSSYPEKSVCDECLNELRTEHEADLFEKCPFCGGDTMEYIISVPYLYGAEGIRVRCKTCGAHGGYGDTRKRTTWDLSVPPIFNRETIEDGFKKAREKWNGRADYRKQSGWISVKEALPDNQRMVLIACEGTTIGGAAPIAIGSFGGGFWFIADADGTAYLTKYMHVVVTHWMDLPEPPKMKGGAE